MKLQTSHRCKCMEIEPGRNKFFTPQILARGLSSLSFASKHPVVLQSKSPVVMSGKSRTKTSRSGTSQAGKSYARLVKTVSTLKSKVKRLNTLKTEVTNNSFSEILKLKFENAKLKHDGRIDIGSMIGSVTYIILLCFFLSLSLFPLSLRDSLSVSLFSFCFFLFVSRPPRAWGLGPPAECLAWPWGGRPPARPGLSRGRAARRGPGGWGHPPRAWAAWPGLWEGRGPRGVGDAPAPAAPP